MLYIIRSSAVVLATSGIGDQGRVRMEWEGTFFSNSLNSSSFCFRYSSISFCASFLASLTRFDRSGVRVRWAGDGGGWEDCRHTFSSCRGLVDEQKEQSRAWHSIPFWTILWASLSACTMGLVLRIGEADCCPYVEESLDTLGILCRLQHGQ